MAVPAAAGLVGVLLSVAPAAAQGPPDEDRLRWSLGLGVLSSPRPYVGADNQTRVIPVLDLEYRKFYFRGVVAGYRLVQRDRLELDVLGRARFGGYDQEDSSFLAGMADRRETVELGLRAAWKLGRFMLEATAAADALGRHDGAQTSLELTWTKIFGRGRAGLVPGVGLTWQSSAFVDYYAGVRAEEALPGRPAFEGRSAVNPGAGLRGFVQLTPKARLIGLVRAERLDRAFEDSPIIDSRYAHFALVAVSYGF